MYYFNLSQETVSVIFCRTYSSESSGITMLIVVNYFNQLALLVSVNTRTEVVTEIPKQISSPTLHGKGALYGLGQWWSS